MSARISSIKAPRIPGLSKFSLKAMEKEKAREIRTRKMPEKVSGWFITVNGHLDARKLNEKQLQEVRLEEAKIATEVLDRKLHKTLIIKEKGGKKKIAKVQVWIRNEEQEFNASHQEHTHALLTIKHRTNLQINYARINQLFRKKYTNSKVFQRIRQEIGLPSGGDPHVHIQRATDDGIAEREYMEKGTHTVWKRKDVAEYYKNLRATGTQDQELFNRFERTGEVFINPPEGYVPGSSA